MLALVQWKPRSDFALMHQLPK